MARARSWRSGQMEQQSQPGVQRGLAAKPRGF